MAWTTIPDWRNRAGAAKTKRTGKVLNDDRADWREAWALFPGEVAYVWHGALHATTVAESLDRLRLRHPRADHLGQGAAGAVAAATITGSTSRCWYAVRRKAKGHWSGDRKQTTLWSIPSRDQDAETVHGTQKPVECMRRPMLNNSSPGQAVYEPFCGSGSTLIAAETTGRVCHAMELDPAYVDVIVSRWQAFTGKDAVLEGERQDLRRRWPPRGAFPPVKPAAGGAQPMPDPTPHVPTGESRRQVSAMVAFGLPQDRIAAVIGISAPTLRKHYREEIDVADAKAQSMVAKYLFSAASGEALKTGASHADCLRAAMFWMKTRAGWKETAVQEVSGPRRTRPRPRASARWRWPAASPSCSPAPCIRHRNR